VELTRLEFDLLRTLAAQPGKAFTRAELTKHVWGYDPAAAPNSRTIDPRTCRAARRRRSPAGIGARFPRDELGAPITGGCRREGAQVLAWGIGRLILGA
jgi:Transcriptional regulatory protein, C terminal